MAVAAPRRRRAGWTGFCQDSAIKRNEAERRTVIERGARWFVIADANTGAAGNARSSLANLVAIEAAAQRPGPFIDSVQPERIVQLLGE